MSTYSVRIFGDPVLKQRASEVSEIDGRIVRLAQDMIATMYEAPGIGLAAPQIGVQKRIFVYDLQEGDGAKVVLNPVLSDIRGTWTYDEGCLSVPGLYFSIVRPKFVHLTGIDINGKELSIEADELLARLFQHEVDHLDGTLLLSHLDDDQRKSALRTLRERTVNSTGSSSKD